MAIEITFGIHGKETTQALFIQESEWEAPLKKVRQIIEQQDLNVPLEYKFLTLNGNAIAHPTEENMVLKDVTRNFINPNSKEEVKPNFDDCGLATETSETEPKASHSPQIWIAPLKVTFSSSASTNTGGGAGSNANGSISGDDDDPLLRDGVEANSQPNARPGSGQCLSCPYKIFMDFIHGQRGPPNPKTLVKVLFVLTFVLFAVLATLTLTLHLMVRTFTEFGKTPAFAEAFANMDMGSSETVANLQIKVSQLELSSKYEIEQLTSRLAELEDLYLRDLAIHKKELNILKKQMTEQRELDEEVESDFMEEELPNAYDRNSKGFEKESNRGSAAKGGQRNKG